MDERLTHWRKVTHSYKVGEAEWSEKRGRQEWHLYKKHFVPRSKWERMEYGFADSAEALKMASMLNSGWKYMEAVRAIKSGAGTAAIALLLGLLWVLENMGKGFRSQDGDDA